MALMFLSGDGMAGGSAHYAIEGAPLVGERRTAPSYRFYSVRDQFPGLYPAAERGRPAHSRRAVRRGDEAAAGAAGHRAAGAGADRHRAGRRGAVVRHGAADSEHEHGGHKDISAYGGWRAYRASMPPPPEAERRAGLREAGRARHRGRRYWRRAPRIQTPATSAGVARANTRASASVGSTAWARLTASGLPRPGAARPRRSPCRRRSRRPGRPGPRAWAPARVAR